MSRDKATSQEAAGSSSTSSWTPKLKLFVVFLEYVTLAHNAPGIPWITWHEAAQNGS